jgi:NAD(P)-dependent dehydrogenase (short-subunit alcohol dehydrogenase family)
METARDLASRGARVILACRNMSRGISACKDIHTTTGNDNIEVRKLNLSSTSSVRDFARDILDSELRLDVLVMNAGVALTKKYMTEDNLELHMASNHFGHFLLANLLAPLMVSTAEGKAEPGRLVTVSSLAHWWGKIELDNLNSEKYYDVSTLHP